MSGGIESNLSSLYRVREVSSLRGFAIEWLSPERVLFSKRNTLYESDRVGHSSMRRVGAISQPLWRSLAIRWRLVQRALRQLFYNVLPLPDGSIFVTYAKEVGVFRDGAYHRLKGLVRPCRVLRGATAVAEDGQVFFGEYLDNAERGPVRIYRYILGDEDVSVVYTFPAGAIRHVHGIYRDPVDRCLWCLTGDIGHEARILVTDDGFETLTTLGSGDESWRAVSVLFTRDAIWYAMDAEFTKNKVFRIDRATRQRSNKGAIDGPVYYSVKWRENLFFAVTAELCPSQDGKSATLWTVHDDALERVVSFDKDRWPVKLLPGTLHFPLGPGVEDGLYFQGVALENADARCFCVELVTG